MNNKFKLEVETEQTSTPIRHKVPRRFQKGNEEISPVIAPIEKKTKLIFLIIEAIKATGDPKKGASYTSIKKWIMDLQGNETNRFKAMLKLALKSGLANGKIIRSSHCQTATGVVGSFKLPKEVPNKPLKKTNKASEKSSSPKVKKQTKEKPIAKKADKVSGKKAPAQPSAPLSKDKGALNDSLDSSDGNKLPKKATSKQPIKRMAKKANPDSKKDPSVKKPEKAKKGEKVVAKGKNNLDKEVMAGNSKSKTKRDNEKENTKILKHPQKRAGQSDATEKAKTEVKKVQKTGRSKKLYAPKRKDFSDTELDVNNHRTMPPKSYSSDTELEVSKRQDIVNKRNTRATERKTTGKKIDQKLISM